MKRSCYSTIFILLFLGIFIKKSFAARTDSIEKLSQQIYLSVDPYYADDELGKIRSSRSLLKKGEYSGEKKYVHDLCISELQNTKKFSNGIAFFVQHFFKPLPQKMQSLAKYYNFSANSKSYLPISLANRKMCNTTRASINENLKNRPYVDTTTLNMINEFSLLHNKYRIKDTENLQKLWGVMFGCLSYTESLTTADTSRSYSVAKKYAPSTYSKPKGVKFYIDPKQSQASKLNIGLFQFTPNAKGNIHPCINQWNQDFAYCPIKNKSNSDMVELIGAPLQSFNAFCGIHKIVQMFFVQTHTSNKSKTDPSNFIGKKLLANEKRCVTPFIHSSKAYNHFGPLQNTTGSNLKKLLSCTLTSFSR